MASTTCSEACHAVYLHAKSFSVSRALAAHVTAPLSSGRAARSCRKSQLGYFLLRSVARLPGNVIERTTTSSLVPFQPFQPGRNKLTHALNLLHTPPLYLARLRRFRKELQKREKGNPAGRAGSSGAKTTSTCHSRDGDSAGTTGTGYV